jgi:heme exporter protein CcmD
MSISGFLRMGGYALYVWSAYGLSLIVLVVIAWSGRRRYAEMLTAARRRLASNNVVKP